MALVEISKVKKEFGEELLFKDVTFPASPLTTSATSVDNAPFITGEITLLIISIA